MEYDGLTEEEILAHAERLLAENDFEEAQKALDAVKGESGRKHFLQSKIFKNKGWYNEERKQLKAALKLEPDNGEYILASKELEEFRKSDEYKAAKKANKEEGVCAECCFEAGGECCLAVCCQSVCDGCS